MHLIYEWCCSLSPAIPMAYAILAPIPLLVGIKILFWVILRSESIHPDFVREAEHAHRAGSAARYNFLRTRSNLLPPGFRVLAGIVRFGSFSIYAASVWTLLIIFLPIFL